MTWDVLRKPGVEQADFLREGLRLLSQVRFVPPTAPPLASARTRLDKQTHRAAPDTVVS